MKTVRNPSRAAILTFLASFFLCAVLITFSIRHKSRVESMAMERVIGEKSARISEVLTRLLYKTQVLSTLAIENDGNIERFERVAPAIVDDPAILNIVIAPGGIVSHVYPLKGNEQVLGYDLFGEGEGNQEAILARERGQFVFAGPFNLVQGEKALVGRLPVWRKAAEGEKAFWGLVSVALKYPEAFAGTGLDDLKKAGFDYEIWRINPDTQERQVIVRSSREYVSSTGYIEMPLRILNAEWVFRILPVRAWYTWPENWILILAGIFISTLIALVVQNNHELRHIHNDLESMIQTDSLTGILNRKGLFDRLDGLITEKTAFQLCYIDLNYFKLINDIYGHHIGDYALVAFSRKMQEHLGENVIFSRISGDEFVLARIGDPLPVTQCDSFWAGVEADFTQPLFSAGSEAITLTFSRGIALFPDDGNTVDELICAADRKMYAAKNARYAVEKRRRHTDRFLP
ncbi:sensor domain-containing diguanylate cyclase [Oxalobacter vibrioformis]|uniref:diguanylate cyclase n=1 Tax=Oxalobacter vibrioformis TaxID=933080 RepID=A0A9E9LYH5_9BURK|nr:diguanylate cyclase [Oxalobacter vibrioformis]WAW09940.1 sensor domain-containing diguanylate cyclase [Oxalobacter vibrioformis]